MLYQALSLNKAIISPPKSGGSEGADNAPPYMAALCVMTKKQTKIVVSLEGGVLDSLLSNCGRFDNCSGLTQELLKRGNVGGKFYLTANDCKNAYIGIIAALNDEVRYPLKQGRDYEGLLKAQKLFELEYERQTNSKIHT